MAIKNRSTLEQDEAAARLDEMLKTAGLSVKATYQIREVALLLDVHRNTVYQMIRKGDVSHIKVRATLRIDRKALIDLIAASLDD